MRGANKMSKTRWKILLFALITAVCVTIFAGCKKDAEQTTFRLTYMADHGGQISGLTVQDVEGNKDGEVVIAIADVGFNFVKWSDGVTTAERQEQNVKEDKTYTAYFEVIKAEPVYYTLKYTAGTGGRIAGETEQTVLENESGTKVTAIADEGYKFVKWTDENVEPTRTESTVTTNIAVTAQFEKLTYRLTYNAAEGGYLVGECNQTVNYGESGTKVTAVPNEGYKFVKWSDGITTAERRDTNVVSDISVTAEFAPFKYYTLTYTAETGGHIEGDTKQSILEFSNGTFVKAVAEDGYTFARWSDGFMYASRQDTLVDENIAITAYFDRLPTYKLTYSTNNSDYGYIQGETNQNVIKGKNGTTVTAMSASEDWVFYIWSDGVETPSRKDLNITSDTEIVAYYRKVVFTYEYAVASSESGQIEGESLQRVQYGNPGTEVTAVPKEGYFFSGWSDGLKTPTRVDSKQYDLKFTAYFVKGLEINYKVNNVFGGHIEGEAKQYVKKGGDTTVVNAIAENGYVFAGWSDCMTISERSEKNLQEDFTMTAHFEPKEKIFRYDYCGATSNANVQFVTVKRDNPKASVFVVPHKQGLDFVGWYADKNYTIRVTDNEGGLMYGYNTITLETDTLYARWADPNDDTIVFKLLIVVVDEIDATLSLRKDHNTHKRVQYKMPMPERILCKQIAGRMSDYLNDWFVGKVKFEIDTYFTTNVVGTDDFLYSPELLDPIRMKEVKHLYDKYDSLLAFYDINDYNGEFREPAFAGMASYKRGFVYLERFMELAFANKMLAEKVMQGDESVEHIWDLSIIDTGLHEFTHTIESRYHYGELYSFDEYCFRQGHSPESIRRYLLCEAEMDGQKVGIPSTFWTEGGTI